MLQNSGRQYVKLKSGIENKHHMFSFTCELQKKLTTEIESRIVRAEYEILGQEQIKWGDVIDKL